MWPFKKQEESEHEKKLRMEREKAELQEAKLRSTECDDDVIAANKLNRIYAKLSENCKTDDDFETALRTYANMQGKQFQPLAKDLNAKKQMRMLRDLSDDDIRRLKEMHELNKGRVKLLGWEDHK